MPELPRYQLQRHPGAHHPHGPVVAAIVEAVMRQAQGLEALTMDVARRPPADPPEQALAREQGVQMGLHVRPRPVRDPRDAIARPRLGPPSPHLASRGVHVGINEREDGRDFKPGAVGQGVDRAEG